MPKPPPVHELEFIKLTSNHAAFSRKLTALGLAATDVTEFAQHIATSWFRLGEQHLEEAKAAIAAGCERAAYSRAYYAAYNISKAVRYLSKGSVSLRSDDHGAASSDLPIDIPQVAEWAQKISTLYEHRLRADYDNWSTTAAENSLQARDAITQAEQFREEARSYVNAKFGMNL